MQQQTIRRPFTLRELGDWCNSHEMTILQGLDFFAPWPTAPAGYTLAPKSETRWIGPETMARGYIITPVWDATTNTHSLDVWMADHKKPNYATLTPAEALQLAADLASTATAIKAIEAAEA